MARRLLARIAALWLKGREPRTIHWPLEIGALGIAVFIWAGGEYLRVRRAPRSGVEKEAQRVLNRIDRRARETLLRPHVADTADRISDALAYVAMPLSCGLGLLVVDRRPQVLLGQALRIGRAVTATGALNQAIKFVAPRDRPFVIDAPEAKGKDRHGSFFSNHTSAVTAMAAATTRVFSEDGLSPLWGTPLYALALYVGYLRIAGDRHFLTDVLAGAVFGTSFGAFSV